MRLSARHSRRKETPTVPIAEIREAIRLNPEEQSYRKQLYALLRSQRDSTMQSP